MNKYVSATNSRSVGNVLFLDDELEALEIVKRILEPKYSVIIAQTIEEADILFNKYNIAVFVVDYLLSTSTDGLTYAKSIHENFPTTRIIMISGVNKMQLVIDAINSGVIDAFITKPVSPDELMDYVDQNYKTWAEKMESIFDLIDQLNQGKPLDRHQITLLGEHMGMLQTLIFTGQTTNQEGHQIKCIGVKIVSVDFDFEYFLDETTTINDEKLLLGFIETFASLSKELFLVSERKVDHIELKGLHLLVRKIDETRVIYFVVGDLENQQVTRAIDDSFQKMQAILLTPESLEIIDSSLIVDNLMILNQTLSQISPTK